MSILGLLLLYQGDSSPFWVKKSIKLNYEHTFTCKKIYLCEVANFKRFQVISKD